jgi:hypothetical protein
MFSGGKERSIQMNVKAFAVAAGILWGFLLFAVTLLEAARGEGHTLSLLVALYPGYSVTYLGSVIGLVYGLISGALVGAAFCWLYNRFAGTSGEAKGKSA